MIDGGRLVEETETGYRGTASQEATAPEVTSESAPAPSETPAAESGETIDDNAKPAGVAS